MPNPFQDKTAYLSHCKASKTYGKRVNFVVKISLHCSYTSAIYTDSHIELAVLKGLS